MMKKTATIFFLFIIAFTLVVSAQKTEYKFYLPVVWRKWSDTMRMTRFGDAYGSAYTFSEANMEDSWQSSRPPLSQQVSGADGAFDYYGANNFPISPVTATKKFVITSSVSSAAIEDELILIREATIAKGRSKLWWLDRDDTTIYWSWAKCVSMQSADTYKEKGKWAKKVELVFFMSEGVWYGETQQSWSNTMVIPASTVGRAVTGLTNSGNVNALLDVRIVPNDSLTMEDSAVGVFQKSQWESAVDVDDGEQFFVLASTYTTFINAVIAEQNSTVIAAGSSIGVWGDGAFVYAANGTDGIHSYSVNPTTGAFTPIDSDDQGDIATAIWGDGIFVYLANATGGIHSYSVDASGNFTHLDSDYPGGSAGGVWGDGKFVYVAFGAQGIHSYSVDSSGNFSSIDSDTTYAGQDVWGDGKFVYLAAGTDGIHSYSVDDSGNLTHVDSDTPGGTSLAVWGDGTFIYAGSGSTLYSYSVDDSGNLNRIDSDGTPSVSVEAIWGDGEFIYVAGSTSGTYVFSVNAVGELTFITSIDPGGTSGDVWGDGTWLYVANGSTLRSYDVDTRTDAYSDLDVGEGNLLNQPDIDQISWLWLPPGTHQTNVVVDCDAGGAAEEVDVYITWWDTYVF